MVLKYFKFFISRLLGTLLETFVLWILSNYVFFTYFGKYIVAPTISFEIVMFCNFVISYYWIWNKHIYTKSTKGFFTRLALFNISSILGFFIKMGFLLLFERLFGWDVVYCNLVALLISGIVNFFLTERVVFKKCNHKPVIDDYMLVKNEHQ
ncbi:MAG: GtrA family protein [Bacteroidales bacterium]